MGLIVQYKAFFINIKPIERLPSALIYEDVLISNRLSLIQREYTKLKRKAPGLKNKSALVPTNGTLQMMQCEMD
jgi:hypothetical protein